MNDSRSLLLIFLLLLLISPLHSFSVELMDSFEETARELKQYRKFIYPYNDINEVLEREGVSSLSILSYGSLMDRDSAKRTLSEKSLKTSQPAIGFGMKRVFDRDVPVNSISSYSKPNDELARGMLNVVPLDDLGSFINGVLIDVDISDLQKVLAREKGYDLIPIIVTSWNDWVDKKKSYSIAYTFHAPQESSYTSSNIKPRPGYYELSRDAAKRYGALFEELWFANTFTADGVTPIETWEVSLLSGDPMTKAVSPK